MNRKILTAVAAFALVGGTFAPAAFARDEHRGDVRVEHRDHGGYDRGRYDDGDRYGGRHDHGPRERLFVVHFHLDGGRGRVAVKSGDRAERVVDLLRSVGADAHIDGSRVVHFRMRGNGRVVRRSHEDAHRLAQKLEGYGFHAHVDHE
jgi:hypothetical protein